MEDTQRHQDSSARLAAPAGAALTTHAYRCGRCHKIGQGAGRGYRFVLGARVQVCAECKAVIDRRRAAREAA